MPDDSNHRGKYYNRIDFQDNQYLGDPIAILNDFDSVREIKVESDKRSLDEILKPDRPKTKGKLKRGVGDKSFREVSPSGQWEPQLAYTIKQAAEFLQMSNYTVLKMCKNGTLKSNQQQNAYRIKGSVILDYLECK